MSARYDAVVRVRMARLPEVITEVMVTSGWDRRQIESHIEHAHETCDFLKAHRFLREIYPSARDLIISTEMRIINP